MFVVVLRCVDEMEVVQTEHVVYTAIKVLEKSPDCTPSLGHLNSKDPFKPSSIPIHLCKSAVFTLPHPKFSRLSLPKLPPVSLLFLPLVSHLFHPLPHPFLPLPLPISSSPFPSQYSNIVHLKWTFFNKTCYSLPKRHLKYLFLCKDILSSYNTITSWDGPIIY